jgi:uncharacterized zinc-type alcohol dehydrogenase-like protein
MNGMVSAVAYGVTGPDAPFTRLDIARRDVGPHDVRIDIAYTGICHSDIHTARNEWGGTTAYPCVPGHEIVGTVAETGSAVTGFAVGDRVGVGCLVDSCRECDPCRTGLEQHCANGPTWTYNSLDRHLGGPTLGGYSTGIVVDHRYVLTIPDTLPLAATAPLLCAGVTLYSPLRRWSARPETRVAIIGLGGLGHIGVKLAAATGADVTVLSQTHAKRDDALRLGAHHYHATGDPDTFKQLRGRFDLILNTVSAALDLDAHLAMLATGGTLVELGLPEQPLTLSAFSLTDGRRNLAGSLIGGIAETQEMLDFCAAHHITADIELTTPDHIDHAYTRMLASDVRYRFVIDFQDLATEQTTSTAVAT